MRLGIAHHYGWAVAVTADDHHQVIDRRRIELLEPDLPAAPIHHHGGQHELHRTGEPPSDEELAALVATVRASAERASSASLDELAADLPAPIRTLSLRAWPADFPTDIATLRRAPYESSADSVMYRQVLADLGRQRGWEIHRFEANEVEREAARLLADRADEVLHGPRSRLGAPWNRDHRMALAATVVLG